MSFSGLANPRLTQSVDRIATDFAHAYIDLPHLIPVNRRDSRSNDIAKPEMTLDHLRLWSSSQVTRLWYCFLPASSYIECNKPSLCQSGLVWPNTTSSIRPPNALHLFSDDDVRRMRAKVCVILPIWLGLADIERVRFRTQNLLIVHCLAGREKETTPDIFESNGLSFDIGDLEV